MFTLPGKRIWVAGHAGMVGSAVMRALQDTGADILMAPRDQIDLRDQMSTRLWVRRNSPDAIVMAAATVGGIGDNQARPADFLYDNLMIEANIIHAAHEASVEKLLFLGSSCIYPRGAAQPLQPESLLTAPLEPTNEAYAIAKIAGIKLCQSYKRQYGAPFISAMPCNLYGPGDRFDARRSHVIPALMLKMHQAKTAGAATLELWGTGTPLREFLHVDDLAQGLIVLLRDYDAEAPVNIGSDQEVTIATLAGLLAGIVGYRGVISFNPAYPDGTPRKVLDSSVIRGLGWSPRVALAQGLEDTYRWFCDHHEQFSRAA